MIKHLLSLQSWVSRIDFVEAAASSGAEKVKLNTADNIIIVLFRHIEKECVSDGSFKLVQDAAHDLRQQICAGLPRDSEDIVCDNRYVDNKYLDTTTGS